MGFRWSRDDASIGDGFRRIAREEIGKAIAAAEGEAQEPGERVHEARRRAKRLRALLRGAGINEYPYDILDASKAGYGGVAIGVAALLVAVAIFAVVFVAIDGWLGRRQLRAA